MGIFPRTIVENEILPLVTTNSGKVCVWVYHTSSDTLAVLYRDEHLTHSRANPVEVILGNPMETFHLESGTYKISVTDTQGQPLYEFDGINVSTQSAEGIIAKFGTVDLLLAPGAISYDDAQALKTVKAGDIIEVAKGGFIYQVAPQDASDHHIETGNGVKLYVQSLSGHIHVQAFGTKNDRVQIEAAISAADGAIVNFGEGITYVSDGPILIGDKNGKANVLGLVGKSHIIFDFEQITTPTSFSHPETRQSGFNCWVDSADAHHIKISDLSLEYVGTFDNGTNSGRVNGMFLSGYKSGNVTNLEAKGFNACGLFLGSGDANLSNEQTKNITVSHCNLSNNRVAGIEIAYTDGIHVTNCQLNRNGISGDTGTGYGFASVSGTQNCNFQIIRNTASHNFRKGIDTHSGENITVSSNNCHGNVLWGIFVSGDSRGIALVRENVVTGMSTSTAAGAPVYGIYVGQDRAAPKALTAIISDNYVEGGQENGHNFYPYVIRSGGRNIVQMRGNTCMCDEVTSFILADDAGINGETNLYCNNNRFEASNTTSYWIRCFEKTLVDLEFCGNIIIDKSGAYYLSAAISFDAGVPNSSADNASRHVSGNTLTVNNAAALNAFFAGSAIEHDNTRNGKRIVSDPEYIISGGEIEIGDTNFIRVDTEGNAAVDDLDTIVATYNRHRIVITAASSSRTIVLKDGVGNLALNGDFSLTHGTDQIELVYKASNALWAELSRSNNTL